MVSELERITQFLQELDAELDFKTPISLYLIGGGAITLAYDQRNQTADLDFIDPPQILVKKGGIESRLAKKYEIYVSPVYEINFSVPNDWKDRANKVDLPLKNVEVFVASVEDVVLGKLARMEPKDMDDILGLKEANLLDPDKLLNRLNENLHEVKNPEYSNNVKLLFREFFGVSVGIRKGNLIKTS